MSLLERVGRRVLVVFILLGLVSLTADMVYEGARSVGGSYIEYLGGPPLSSAIASLGDLIGYGLRFVSGVLASYYMSSGVLWGFTIAGYVLTTATLPLLAFAGSWQLATTLYLLERVGKGLRTPPRDVILAEVTEKMGRGLGFGLHELMDQLGAVAGPVLVGIAIVVYGFSGAFLVLLAPGIVSVALVLTAYRLYPELESIRASRTSIGVRGLGRRFWVYTASMMFFSTGYVHWMIVSYYLYNWRVMSPEEIAWAYGLAMLVDGLSAVPIGLLYDKTRYRSLYIVPLTALTTTVLLIESPVYGRWLAYLMAGLWGISMGCYETIMRASIADLVDPGKRAMAYGVFGLLFGVSWTLGAFVYSLLLSVDPWLTTLYTLSVETVSIILLYILNKRV